MLEIKFNVLFFGQDEGKNEDVHCTQYCVYLDSIFFSDIIEWVCDAQARRNN